MEPTKVQCDYARDLMRNLGYDEDDYDLDAMERWEVSQLIADLKEERDG